jgi:hypothetical protein
MATVPTAEKFASTAKGDTKAVTIADGYLNFVSFDVHRHLRPVYF